MFFRLISIRETGNSGLIFSQIPIVWINKRSYVVVI